MISKPRTWRQKIQRHPFIAMSIIILLIVCIAFALAVHWLGWGWTGLTSYSPPTPQYQRGKTLWDWLQLLVIPLMLAIGGFWLNQIQKGREQRAIDERVEREKRETEQRAEAEREAAEKRDKTEREIAADNQREAVLQSYIDKMSELLLHDKLRESTTEEDERRKIARVRTITVLFQLDARRIGYVFAFLLETGLMSAKSNDNIVSLSQANLDKINLSQAILSGANLSRVQLRHADLSRAELYETNLSRAILIQANLSQADLGGANLSRANLSQANLHKAYIYDAILSGAQLVEADLSQADLSGTNFSQANLSRAILSGAHLSRAILTGVFGITPEELEKQAESLEGATMPDGSIHS